MLQRKLKELQRDRRDYQKKISNAERTIVETKKKIDVNKLDQLDAEDSISKQKDLLKEIEGKVRSFAVF